MLTLEIVERRTTSISRAVYDLLEHSSDFWELVDSGVVSLVRSRDIPYGIRAYNQVGQAIIGNKLCLVVREKIEDALHGLFKWSVPEDFRQVQTISPLTAYNPILYLYSVNFLESLGSYLRHGRNKQYEQSLEQSIFPSGRIDVKLTAKLRARGRVGQVAFRRTILVADTLTNRLLALGLLAVELYSSSLNIPNELQSKARVYAPLFDDVDRFSLTRASRERVIAAFDLVLSDAKTIGELRKAIIYARAMVLHLGIRPDIWRETLPHSYFVNLESVFEEALLSVFAKLLPNMLVTRGKVIGKPLFVDLPKAFISNPDIVVSDSTGAILVADAKNKDVVNLPEHDDIYQLLAHSISLKSKTALLVYPGNVYRLTRLGITETDTVFWWCTVRPQSLQDDTTSLLSQMMTAVSTGGVGNSLT